MSSFPKKVNGKWEHSFRVNGRGTPRYRRTFNTKAEALEFEVNKKSQWISGTLNRKNQYDGHRFSELVDAWYDLNGINLKDGVRRKAKLLIAAEHLKDPIAKELNPLKYISYRAKQLKSGKQKKTLNNELGYIKRVYNYFIGLNALSPPNPLEGIKGLSLDESSLTYLEQEEIDELFRTIYKFSVNPHVGLIAEICLSTGARWGEAEGLTLKAVRNNSVTLGNDNSRKSGKNRTVPIEKELFDRLVQHLKKYGNFTSSLGAFRRALEKTNIELPKGQASHVLRHSYASHYMILGGRLVGLKELLGHSDIKMTMRYAHLSRSHLRESLKYSPSKYIPKGTKDVNDTKDIE